MTKVAFFHQYRKDGALRTGVEIDGEMVLHQFIPAKKQPDPVLMWFIDLRFSLRDAVVSDSESARTFLADIAVPIQRALRRCADELRAGVDPDTWPGTCKVANLPAGITGEIVFSATKRLTRGELSHAMRQLADEWVELLGHLEKRMELAY